jgi:predicted NBD/HSP70 family sugar kinase
MIYDIIRRSGPISRIDIHRKFHIRKATITRITESLLEKNLICGSGKDPSGLGRTPELITVNESAFHVIGLHAVSNAIRGGIVLSGGKMESYSTMDLPPGADKKRFLAAIGRFAIELLGTAKKNNIKISGIGLAMPGEVDYESGTLKQAAVILPGLIAVPCKTYLTNKTGLPVVVDHDCAMITLAEVFWGKAKARMNIGTMFIGHGIGGRFFINGRLYRGARNRGGELGHIPLRHSGPLCKCGLRGCFEALASIPVIEKNCGGINFNEVIERAINGEKKPIAALHQAAGHIGEAAAIIFDMFDIDLLVINGDIISAEKIITKSVLASAISHMHSKQPLNKEFIAFSSFGQEVGVLGAAAVCIQNVLSGHGIDI